MLRFITLALVTAHLVIAQKPAAIFADHFDAPESRGELSENPVIKPPPVGMGYRSKVITGYTLKNWIVAEGNLDDPRISFWCIPVLPDGSVDTAAMQAGRSRDAILYAKTPVPAHVDSYVISFRQHANDNDYIGYIIGASKPVLEHDGLEFGSQRQLPGTDEHTPDLHLQGVLGKAIVPDMALRRQWAFHRIEVTPNHLHWTIDGETIAEKSIRDASSGGYFGIRLKFERGTSFDDIVIRPLSPRS